MNRLNEGDKIPGVTTSGASSKSRPCDLLPHSVPSISMPYLPTSLSARLCSTNAPQPSFFPQSSDAPQSVAQSSISPSIPTHSLTRPHSVADLPYCSWPICFGMSSQPITNTHRMQTRSKSNISKPELFLFLFTSLAEAEPTTFYASIQAFSLETGNG